MPVFQLDERLLFPRPHLAHPSGLLAVGGDLRPERLLLAYANGIFPWPTEELPLLWHSPDPRFVLARERLHVPRSLAKRIRRGGLRITMDRAFREVIEACARESRPEQDGTWITGDMVEAYDRLHELGFAHSVEAWSDEGLAGGLYGVSLGGVFFGESMFAAVPEASKVAFVTAMVQFGRWEVDLVDSQVHTPHLERFGAELWSRERYLARLAELLERPTRSGIWELDGDLTDGAPRQGGVNGGRGGEVDGS